MLLGKGGYSGANLADVAGSGGMKYLPVVSYDAMLRQRLVSRTRAATA
jgi:hypothetical protein